MYRKIKNYPQKVVKLNMISKTVIALSICSVICSTQAFAAKPSGKAWKSGAWTARIFVNDNTGAFSHCQMVGRYSSQFLVFSINKRYKLRIGLSNKKWNLPTDQRYKLGLTVDGLFLGSHPAKPVNSRTIVMVPKGNAKLIFKKLRVGNILKIKAEKQTFRFKLTGTNAALNRLLKCVKIARGAGETSRNPFGEEEGGKKSNPFGGKNNRDQNRGSGKTASDGQKIARNLISRIGDKRYRLLLPTPDRLRRLKADAVWRAPGGYGAIHTLTRRYSMATLKNKLETGQRKNCVGNFHAAAQMRYIGGKSKSPIIKIACRKSKAGKPYFVNYAFYRKKGGGSYRIMHVSAQPEGANEADRTMFREIEKILVARRSK